MRCRDALVGVTEIPTFRDKVWQGQGLGRQYETQNSKDWRQRLKVNVDMKISPVIHIKFYNHHFLTEYKRNDCAELTKKDPRDIGSFHYGADCGVWVGPDAGWVGSAQRWCAVGWLVGCMLSTWLDCWLLRVKRGVGWGWAYHEPSYDAVHRVLNTEEGVVWWLS